MDRPISALTIKSVNSSRLSSSTPQSLHRVRAFTLIEAVIVLIVLGILTAAATATYRTIELNTYNNNAQLTVATSAAEAEAYYTNNGAFPTISDFNGVNGNPPIEPSYTFVDGSSPNGLSQTDTTVSVFSHSIAGVEVETFTTLSTSGNCYEITDWPPNDATPDSYIVTTPAQCYASNVSDTTEATQW